MYDKEAAHMLNKQTLNDELGDVKRAVIKNMPTGRGDTMKVPLVEMTQYCIGTFYVLGIKSLADSTGRTVEDIEKELEEHKRRVSVLFESNMTSYGTMSLVLLSMAGLAMHFMFSTQEDIEKREKEEQAKRDCVDFDFDPT